MQWCIDAYIDVFSLFFLWRLSVYIYTYAYTYSETEGESHFDRSIRTRSEVHMEKKIVHTPPSAELEGNVGY